MLLLALAACNASDRTSAAEPQPNVLLISLDTTRADHCSFLGYPRDTTPNLRRLALRGVSFRNAFAAVPSTGPSHATIFTSLYPISHGLVKNTLALDDDHVTLAEVLRDQGYQTASVVSSFVLHSKFGFAQGFEDHDDRFELRESVKRLRKWEEIRVPSGAFDRRGDHTTDRAIRRLESRDPDRPLFLFVHYFDPHNPYLPPEPFRSQFRRDRHGRRELEIRDAYDGEIAFTDHQIGRLLAALDTLGLAANTLIVVVGDHGEGLLQHGHMEHGVQLYDEAVRVPLLIYWPGRAKENSVISQPVQLLQLAPTILELLGIHGEGPLFERESWAEAVRGEAPLPPDQPVFLQTDSPLTRPAMLEGEDHTAREDFAIRKDGWKFIEGPEAIPTETAGGAGQVSGKALFDLERDPGELNNLLTVFPKRARRLAAELHRWKAAHSGNPSDPAPLSEEELQNLRTLGYVK